MRLDSFKLGRALLVASVLALAGCGGHDRITVGEAQEKFSADCEQGHFGDRARCGCIVDDLRARGRSGPEIDALREAMNFGTPRAELTQSSSTCDARLRRARQR